MLKALQGGKIGFVGLGNMGLAMAKNLNTKFSQKGVKVFDVSTDRLQEAKKMGL
jgi:3-hydroxyisobutyrate dehydrogenase-like beta-hydroxyacid dehydrogenase